MIEGKVVEVIVLLVKELREMNKNNMKGKEGWVMWARREPITLPCPLYKSHREGGSQLCTERIQCKPSLGIMVVTGSRKVLI